MTELIEVLPYAYAVWQRRVRAQFNFQSSVKVAAARVILVKNNAYT
jgi:hypothetical protein